MPISKYMKKRLLMYGIEEDKIKIIYNITELDVFFKLKTPKNKVSKILYLGEYSKPKGPHIIIEALKDIKLPYEANFYGSGVLKNKLLEETKKYKLNVTINDKVDYRKIPSILKQHDIIIFPSLVGEAFGRVVLEACASGKTVIASNIGGVTDIIEHNKTGFLFSPGNIKELRLLLEKVLRKDISLNPIYVKNRIKLKFSNKKTISKVKNIYKNLVSK
jgi:glycosyltransferase involved in cell wall biosynthesis